MKSRRKEEESSDGSSEINSAPTGCLGVGGKKIAAGPGRGQLLIANLSGRRAKALASQGSWGPQPLVPSKFSFYHGNRWLAASLVRPEGHQGHQGHHGHHDTHPFGLSEAAVHHSQRTQKKIDAGSPRDSHCSDPSARVCPAVCACFVRFGSRSTLQQPSSQTLPT